MCLFCSSLLGLKHHFSRRHLRRNIYFTLDNTLLRRVSNFRLHTTKIKKKKNLFSLSLKHLHVDSLRLAQWFWCWIRQSELQLFNPFSLGCDSNPYNLRSLSSFQIHNEYTWKEEMGRKGPVPLFGTWPIRTSQITSAHTLVSRT